MLLKVLSEHLNSFIDLSEKARMAEVIVEKEEDDSQKVMDMNIDELELVCTFLQLLEESRNQHSRRVDE